MDFITNGNHRFTVHRHIDSVRLIIQKWATCMNMHSDCISCHLVLDHTKAVSLILSSRIINIIILHINQREKRVIHRHPMTLPLVTVPTSRLPAGPFLSTHSCIPSRQSSFDSYCFSASPQSTDCVFRFPDVRLSDAHPRRVSADPIILHIS